ncbi:MAG: hypothetical protein U0326_16570 [Polyangiales bacterium]
MKNFVGRVCFLSVVVAANACSDIAAEVSGSCTGTETVATVRVNVCSESPTLTISNQATLNSICRSGQLGAAANTWNQGVACTAAGRVGGCRRTVNGIDVITWIYSTSPAVNAATIRAFCAQIMATYQSP